MRGRSHSGSPPRGGFGGRRGRSPSPRGRSRDAPTSPLVRNLGHDCRPEDLRRPFGQFGQLKDIYLPRDYYSGRRHDGRRSPACYPRSPRYSRSPPPGNVRPRVLFPFTREEALFQKGQP